MTTPPPGQDALPLDVPEPAAAPMADFRAPLPGPVRYDLVPSPLGDLLLTGDGESLTGLHMDAPPPPDAVHDPGSLRATAEELRAYFAGELREFSARLAPSGSAFQLQVWRRLTSVPYGRTASYGDIARALDAPGASRAVGTANNRNPISIVIPCHRIVGADGSLVGYGGGLPRKQILLRLERTGRL
ncbi:methylated-DNA--[protein]-cysteine S-methyltransferase [Nocardiopsis composta]|uniref:Methylated-DNA--protein-cysteine methyltransferase n=1 Tax=Nocardiopsis composta TaxID=157465 RepID=A0A7W8QP19_9ACTN|nr:methylated-DNA--[protein]-cysteine S-methyltransferase [Nocardiopsis composta]MBB5432966.1 methylated-DNA-[protein]-cysteine S-methyltransferase [Nocardiopsis composta]